MNRLNDIKEIIFGSATVENMHMLPTWCDSKEFVYREIEAFTVDNCDETLDLNDRLESWIGADIYTVRGFIQPAGMKGSDGFKWFCNQLLQLSHCFNQKLDKYQINRLFVEHIPIRGCIVEYKDCVYKWAKTQTGEVCEDFKSMRQNHYAAYKAFCFITGLAHESLADLYDSESIIQWLNSISTGCSSVKLTD